MAHGETYEQFTQKFKPKKTTDDCYTPPAVMEAALGGDERKAPGLPSVGRETGGGCARQAAGGFLS